MIDMTFYREGNQKTLGWVSGHQTQVVSENHAANHLVTAPASTGHLLSSIVTLSVLLCLPLSAGARNGGMPNTREIKAYRTSSPPVIDGLLSDSCWKDTSCGNDFIQYDPLNGADPSESTHAHVAYDENNLYLGFHCFEGDPRRILTSLSPRDRLSGDDMIEVILDTYGDCRNAFRFAVNPCGVQVDRIYSVGSGNDLEWDAVWRSSCKLVDNGWTAELAIPFKQLRFPRREEQTWSINFRRFIARTNETIFWTRLLRNESLLEVSGRLFGITGLQSGLHLEFLPYVAVGESKWKTERTTKKEFGLDAKYGLTTSLTLCATANPDYSQVEADVVKINLTPYETYYPEKRPFFLEGGNIFHSPIHFFYSRRISNPSYGLKLTGRLGEYSFGMIHVGDEPRGTPKSRYSIVRAKKDILKSSEIGIFLTSKEGGGGKSSGDANQHGFYNRAYGLDGKLVSKGTSLLRFQVGGTKTKGIQGQDRAYYLEIRHLPDVGVYLNAFYTRFEEDFLPKAGYVSRPNYQRSFGFLGYRFRVERHGIRRFGIEVFLDKGFENAGKEIFSYPGSFLWVHFTNGTWANLSYRYGREVWDNTGYKPIGYMVLNMGLGMSGPFDATLWYKEGKDIIYDQEILGHERHVSVEVTIKPERRVKMEHALEHRSQFKETNRGKILMYSGLVNRISYQFSKSVYIRLISDSNTYSHQHQFQVLLGAEYRLGSYLYVTYYENRDNSTGRLALTDRTFFSKVSFWYGT